MNAALLRQLLLAEIQKSLALLDVQDPVAKVKVIRNPDGTVTTAPSGTEPRTMENIGAICDGVANAVVLFLNSVKVDVTVAIPGAQPGPAALPGKGIGTLV